MFDDRYHRPVAGKLRHQFKRRIGVIDVVVRKLLTLPLPRGSHPLAPRPVGIKRRLLVRVLAIAQPLRELARKRLVTRKRLAKLARQPARHRRIISRRLGKRGKRHLLPERQTGRPIARFHLLQQRRIIRRVGDHRHKPMVLRCSPDHRWPADVDILDAGRMICALGDSIFKRVQVGNQQINRLDPMRGHRQQMLVIIAQRQQCPVDIRVQRLDPPIHHFRKARHLGHIPHLQPGGAQHVGCASGRDQFDPKPRQGPAQFDQPGLVGNRDQRAANRDEICHGGPLANCQSRLTVSSRTRSRMASGVSCAFAKVQPSWVSKSCASPESTICRLSRGLSRVFSR